MARTSRAVNVVIQALRRDVNNSKVDLAIDTTKELIRATPKDTQWAASNWIPKVGAPDDTPKPQDRRTANIGRAKAEQQAAIDALRSVRLVRGNIFVTNNVPYLPILNNGSSTQAPAGFVQAALSRAIARSSRRRSGERA